MQEPNRICWATIYNQISKAMQRISVPSPSPSPSAFLARLSLISPLVTPDGELAP